MAICKGKIPVANKSLQSVVLVDGQPAAVFDADSKQDRLSPTQVNNINSLAALINPSNGQNQALQTILNATYGKANAIDIWRNQLVNPLNMQVQDLQTIINALVGMVSVPINYFDLAALGLTYAAVQALNATYFEVVHRGQQIFTGGI